MQPQVETMISLPVFEKARSITHCCHLLGGQEVSVERKYDGEYCQVHVLSSSGCESRVTIFSKSGRNSTVDRKLLLPTIRTCLDLDTPDCRVQRQCVLVGELLVWNDQQREIVPFYKIRRYVTREGRQLGCDQDSPPSPDEHLMMMFYDIHLLDDLSCIYEPYERRRQRLNALVRPVPGRAEIGEWEKMDFRRPDSAVNLAHRMANAISQNWEGLVLKACQDAYISTCGGIQKHVKLKKDYIPGLGDSADLVVVGGRRDASVVHTLGSGNWSWTAFSLACVENKDAVLRQNAKAIFRIVGEVSRPSISIEDVRFLNRHGMLCETPFTPSHSEMEVRSELASVQLPTTLFTRPAVVGAGFDRPSNSHYHTLRFPRVVKIHHDRSFLDAVDFAAYQSP
jgi:DNA ligase-4